MARINLKGMGVALVTPFKQDKSIDFDALARLLEYQIKNGVDYMVVLGTTAETATLSSSEKKTGKRVYCGTCRRPHTACHRHRRQ